MKVNWKKHKAVPTLGYDDLNVGDTFKNKFGKGAVYMKVRNHAGATYWMLELETGTLFPPTSSLVELVDCEININDDKPNIYNKR